MRILQRAVFVRSGNTGAALAHHGFAAIGGLNRSVNRSVEGACDNICTSKLDCGGGIVAVVPGRFAIATFSPPLNPAGNSVRGMKAIRFIAGELGVGLYGPNPSE